MKLSEVLNISGQPGLHRFIGQNKGGVIVETLAEGRRFLVSATSKVSALTDIAIFTQSEDLPLGEVLQKIYDATEGKEIENPKKLSNSELKSKMVEFLPEYDDERVHVSDMKKLFAWYNILVAAGFTTFVEEEDEQEPQESAE